MIYNVGGNFREECLELPQGASQSFAPGAGGVKQVLLEPGEFALFHNNIVHGSPPNRAARGGAPAWEFGHVVHARAEGSLASGYLGSGHRPLQPLRDRPHADSGHGRAAHCITGYCDCQQRQ
jgi:hypothetical protein